MYTEYSTLKPQFQSISLYDQPFSRYRLVKNQNAPNDRGMTLITEVSKVPCVHWILNPEAQMSLCFTLRSLVFQIIEFFAFPIGYNGEIQKFVKNRNLITSKLHNSTFVKDNWEENSGKGWKDSKVIWGRSSVLKFWLPLVPMLMKTKKNPEKSKTPNFKNPKQYFCQDQWEENSEKVWKDSKVIWGRSSFGFDRVPC